MPFKSKAQKKFLFANYPEIAKLWQTEHYEKPSKKLPEHVKKKKKKGA